MSIKHPSKVSGNRTEAGYTLLELLFSISITGLLLAILSQFLLSGVRMWERNDRGYRRQHQLKLVYQTAYNEISTMCYGEYLPEYLIDGGDTRLSFWRETPRGLEFVNYRYDLNEKVIYHSQGFYGSEPPEVVLYKGIENWEFEYFDPKNRNWLREWKSDKKELPALIRITVKTKDADLGTLTVPVKAWHVVLKNEFGT